MNKNIDLTKILKECPKGWKLYSPIVGEIDFSKICDDVYAIVTIQDCRTASFTKEGFYYADVDGECLLFPSKDQRDWSKFTAPWYKKEKFDPKTLKAFDRVLARIGGGDAYCWFADFVSTPMIEKYDILPCIMSNKVVEMIIPYNENTRHLVGTTDEAPEYYRYWED